MNLKKNFLENKLIKKLSLFFIRIFPIFSCFIYLIYFGLIIYNYFNNNYYIMGDGMYLFDPLSFKYIIFTTINQYNIIPWIIISIGLRFCLYHRLLILYSLISCVLYNIQINIFIIFVIILFIISTIPYIYFVCKIKKKYGNYKK